MNQDTLQIALTQFSDPRVFGLLLVFLTPIIFGAITAWYSHKTTHKVTMKWWKQVDKD